MIEYGKLPEQSSYEKYAKNNKKLITPPLVLFTNDTGDSNMPTVAYAQVVGGEHQLRRKSAIGLLFSIAI